VPNVDRAIHIEGLAQLETAFKRAGTGIDKDLRDALKSSAEPVKVDAQSRASGVIHVSAVNWTAMRVGITRHTVYVAPVEKGRRSRANPKIRRPKVKPRLLQGALDPALEANRPRVAQEVRDAVRDMGRAWGRV
jgi:hypothetical protein